ncbi:MAG: DUF1343 domain-containing protein [Sphingopyxis sp.]
MIRLFAILTLLFAAAPAAAEPLMLGIDVLLSERGEELAGKHIGLVTNAAAIDGDYRSTLDRLAEASGVHLVALFGPEHGVRGDAQAGAHIADAHDAATGLPVYSLYGATREPSAAMLAGIDLIIIDLPDVGARTYTYAATVIGVLRAAQRAAIAVMLLDRPNPIGGVTVEGPMLDPAFASFVGPFPMPMRHGMTMGELARLFNTELAIGAELHLVSMRGWQRSDGAAGPWVPPSPNLPTRDSALAYPGMVLVEGTNLSEGRGTTRPFEMIGAPYIDPAALAAAMNARRLPGVRFRGLWFTPTSSKYAGTRVGGVQVHVTDRSAYRPVHTAVALLQVVAQAYPDDFRIEGDNPAFFERLAGNGWLRGAVMTGEAWQRIEARDTEAMARFMAQREAALLYR